MKEVVFSGIDRLIAREKYYAGVVVRLDADAFVSSNLSQKNALPLEVHIFNF